MQIITKVTGVDSKAGRRSRTGSTITMGVDDLLAIQCQQYFMALETGKEPSGDIKKIELVVYMESDLSTKENDSKVDEMTLELETVLDNSDELTNGQANIIEQSHQSDLKIFDENKESEKLVGRPYDNTGNKL